MNGIYILRVLTSFFRNMFFKRGLGCSRFYMFVFSCCFNLSNFHNVMLLSIILFYFISIVSLCLLWHNFISSQILKSLIFLNSYILKILRFSNFLTFARAYIGLKCFKLFSIHRTIILACKSWWTNCKIVSTLFFKVAGKRQ